MNFDFIRYKVRIFQSTAFKVILFGGESKGASTFNIRMFSRNGRPFAVVFGASVDIEALATILASKKLGGSVEVTSSFDVKSVILTALHVASSLEEKMPFSVNGVAADAAVFNVSMEETLAFISKIDTPNSHAFAIDLTDMLDLEASMATSEHSAFAVAMHNDLTGVLNLHEGDIIEAASFVDNYTELEMAVSFLSPIAVLAVASNAIKLEVLIDLYNSAQVASGLESELLINALVTLLKKTSLQDNDAYSLFKLDTKQLQAIAFIEI